MFGRAGQGFAADVHFEYSFAPRLQYYVIYIFFSFLSLTIPALCIIMKYGTDC